MILVRFQLQLKIGLQLQLQIVTVGEGRRTSAGPGRTIVTPQTLQTGTLLIDDELRHEAESIVSQGSGRPLEGLSVRVNGQLLEIPERLSELLIRVIERSAEGGTTVIETLPDEVTTTRAAHMIGISRPTLMRLIELGEIPARKVGSHTRLRSAEVLAFAAARDRARDEARAKAFAKLRALDEQLGVNW